MKNVIGITGTIASGKDHAGKYISKKLEVPLFEISGPIIEAARQRGISPTREEITKFSPIFAKEKGEDYSARVHLAQIESLGIITGMRQVAQIEYLRSNSHLILLAIDAETRLRFERAKSRGKFPEAASLEEFIRHDRLENSGPNTMRVQECMRMADYRLKNNTTLKDLEYDIDCILRTVMPEITSSN